MDIFPEHAALIEKTVRNDYEQFMNEKVNIDHGYTPKIMTKKEQMNIFAKVLAFWIHKYSVNEHDKSVDGVDAEYLFKNAFISEARMNVYNRIIMMLNKEDQTIVNNLSLKYLDHLTKKGIKVLIYSW